MKKSTLLKWVLAGSLVAAFGFNACSPKEKTDATAPKKSLVFIHAEPMGENYESLAYIFTAEEVVYKGVKILNPKTILKDLGPDGSVDEIIEENQDRMKKYIRGQTGMEEKFEIADEILKAYCKGNFEAIYEILEKGYQESLQEFKNP